jgi:hypothetical protein
MLMVAADASIFKPKERFSMKATKIALMVLTAFGVILITSASALAASTNNPQWSLKEGTGGVLTLLASGASGTLEAAAVGKQQLKGSGLTISCEKLKVSGATIKGSAAPAPGTSEETIEYSECEVVGFAKCLINGKKAKEATLTTNALKDTLAFETKAAAEGEVAPTVTLFEPVAGKVFITFSLTKDVGGACPIEGEVKVEGSVVAKNLGGETPRLTQEIEAPETAITKYFVNSAGKTEEKKAELKVLGLKATYFGNSTIKVKSGTKQEEYSPMN